RFCSRRQGKNPMKVESAYFSQKGQKEKNDDSILPPFSSKGVWWAAVADGMGGHAGASVASAAVIDALRALIETDVAEMSELFSSAQDCLKKIAEEKPDLVGMGTTLSLIRLSGQTAKVGHVGDSRIYHLRSDGILDRTVDQTEVEQLVRQGVLSRARARRYPRRHILLSVLSPKRNYQLHEATFEIREGD